MSTRCDCTARCGDDPGLARGVVHPCARRREAEQRVLRDAAALVLMKELRCPDTLAALQELKALRARKGRR
jgi:hypothetical protein